MSICWRYRSSKSGSWLRASRSSWGGAARKLDAARADQAVQLTRDLEAAISRSDGVRRQAQARASAAAFGAVVFLSGFAGTAFPNVTSVGVSAAVATSAFALGAGVANLGLTFRFVIDWFQSAAGLDGERRGSPGPRPGSDGHDDPAVGLVDAEPFVMTTTAERTKEVRFSDPSRSHCFIFVDQAAEDIDPANAGRVG
jgi:hypothetical protein